MKRKVLKSISLGLLSTLLMSCDPSDETNSAIANGIVGLGSTPRVCLSDIKSVREGNRIGFVPVVHNRGVADSVTDFFVILYEGGGSAGQFNVPGTLKLVGTGGSTSSSAGPNETVGQQYLQTANGFWRAYDPQKRYKLEAQLHSADDNFVIASTGCRILTKTFLGDQPVP